MRISLLFVGILMALLAGEVVARGLWELRPPATATAEAPPPDPSQLPEDWESLPDLRRVRDLDRPNLRAMNAGAFYRTNSAGFRGPEVSRRPAPGTFRVVVAGDSVTMGHGVAEADAYPARLEALLREAGWRPRVEVLNLGLSGTNLHSVAGRIERIGLPQHPDLIVYGFTVNDIKGPDYRADARPSEAVARRDQHLRFAESPSYLLRSVWPRWLTLRDLVFRPPGSLGHEIHSNFFENPPAWEHFTAGLDRLVEIGTREGVCVHVLIHTFLAQLDWLHPFDDVYERVAGAARERGLTVTETFPSFRGEDALALRVHFADPHPNASGHALLADSLHAGLRQLPVECWEK
jgi:lysophospholipase L1-like esterase